MNLQEIQTKSTIILGGKNTQKINIIDLHREIRQYRGILERMKKIQQDIVGDKELITFLSINSLDPLGSSNYEALRGDLQRADVKIIKISAGLFFNKNTNRAYIEVVTYFCDDKFKNFLPTNPAGRELESQPAHAIYRWYHNLRIIDQKGEIIDLSPKRS